MKVRKSACHSSWTLTALSTKFAVEVLNLLIDVLNDDSMVVRLQALETLHHMAASDCLKVQETHMHMVCSRFFHFGLLLLMNSIYVLFIIVKCLLHEVALVL